MKPEVIKDLKDSARDFSERAWPVIRDWCGGGELVPVEAVTATPFARLLDNYSGIDHWQVKPQDGQIRGLASRVQWGEDWRTFTVRFSRPSGVPTEYHKRMAALHAKDEGWLFPALTAQAYLTKRAEQLLSVAIVTTADLYAFLESYNLENNKRTTSSGEEFLWLPWDWLRVSGVNIGIWIMPAQGQLPLGG